MVPLSFGDGDTKGQARCATSSAAVDATLPHHTALDYPLSTGLIVLTLLALSFGFLSTHRAFSTSPTLSHWLLAQPMGAHCMFSCPLFGLAVRDIIML